MLTQILDTHLVTKRFTLLNTLVVQLATEENSFILWHTPLKISIPQLEALARLLFSIKCSFLKSPTAYQQ